MKHSSDSVEILRFPEVKALTKLSRTTIWRLQRQGRFPRCFRLSAGLKGWLKSDIVDWMRRCAESSEDR